MTLAPCNKNTTAHSSISSQLFVSYQPLQPAEKLHSSFLHFYSFILRSAFYPHMPIGKVWIYRLLFVCNVVRLRISPAIKDKASGVKLCMVVQRRPEQKSPIFGNFAPPEAQNRTNRRARGACTGTPTPM